MAAKQVQIRALVLGPVGIPVLVLAVLLVLARPLSFIEVRALDGLFALLPPSGLDSRVVVIDTGEDLALYERWRPPGCPKPDPERGITGCDIPRTAYTSAVRRLSDWGAKAIVLDLMFSRSCPAEDAKLATAFREAGTVIVAATTKIRPGEVSLKDPVPVVRQAVWAVGSPYAAGPNEVIRSVPLVWRDCDSGREYRALSLLGFLRFRGAAPNQGDLTGDGSLVMGNTRVPLVPGEQVSLLPFGRKARNQEGSVAAVEVVSGNDVRDASPFTSWNAMLVNWSGPKGTIQSHLLRDVLEMDSASGRAIFGGRAVIIGRQEWDEHLSAVGPMYGPDVQANALHTLISGRFIRPLSPWLTLGLLVLCAASASLAVRRTRVVRGAFVVLLLMVGALGLARELLAREGVWTYLFLAEACILLSWGITTSAQSGKVAALLHRFMPAFMAGTGVGEAGEVQTRDASILYSDIRNFTTISEELGAEATLRLLRGYRSAVETVIRSHGGAIVITPGDAILAVFWRDHKGASHPTCAVRAGKEVLEELPALAEPWETAGVSLVVGFGVNAGPVAMGFMGDQNLEATVIGDAVNVAQRLETLTKDLGYPLITSESVHTRLREDLGGVYVDEVTVKGRKETIRVYGVPGP